MALSFPWRSRAKSIDINPALHPIPDKLKLLILLLSLYLFITIAERDGVGEKRLQFTIKISMSLGFNPVFSRRESIAEKMTSSASPLEASMVGLVDALGVVLEDESRMFHEGGEGDAAGDGGFEAGVVNEEDGIGSPV
ncbi:hypothetical protein G2W53_018983 [Senna tora]|uniref:Uncharacterized protein n=1 Tax=Senna tora TaxID=362788 RepID=A0A834U1G7_9FABA|nr:hypothetical protein G2W53_018983 [Senna tora]